MTRSDFQSGDPNQCGAERTKETYNSAAERLKTEEMGDMDQSSISNAITKVLPDLAPSVLGIVVETLQSLGVETTEDFDFVQESDLMSVLRPIQARKLVAAWEKKLTQSTEIHIPSSLSSSTSPTSSSVSLSPSPGRVLAVLDWVDSFQIPWDKFPEALLQCLERGKRPAPKLRREMIRIVASEMMKVNASPSKQASTEVAKKLIAKYPQSLQDVIEGDVVGSGYHSLVKQLQARIENVKRSSTPRIKKRKECSDDSLTDEVPAEKKAAVQDTYGCIKWDMKFMPVTETTESQKEKKEKMKRLHRETNVSLDEVENLMKCTYYSQRKDINNGEELQTLLEEWPFLFQEVGMAVHFYELTGVSLKETFLNSLEKKGKRLLDFMRNTCADKSKRVLQAVTKLQILRGQLQGCSEDVKDMVLLLLSYFDEREENLFRHVEQTCLGHEIQMESLPVTPCIIVCGDIP
ncbi:uncharacterized protein LOC120443128 [Oreochromis aureus]|uniref:Uncharacterized protein n=1 Tax=Oreochromis aureus TaxID=47969 RepID=A0AAZ1XBY5_OREAU|nr:uncharacterized protein LOC120443128 [Oreochromis aureus]